MPATRLSPAPSPSSGHGPVLTPMPLWQTALFFSIPAIVIAIGFLVLLPALQSQGMSRMLAFTLVDVICVGGLIPAALIAMTLEGRPLTWVSIRTRLRLKPDHRCQLELAVVWHSRLCRHILRRFVAGRLAGQTGQPDFP